ncbi:MAG: hypothetical protein COA52_17025, partial [Hyphomicrobiales bacterium]
MKIFRALAVLTALTAFSSSTLADQSDPRLPGLFDLLQEVDNAGDAAQIEQKIWGIWHEAPNDELQDIMERGVSAMNYGDFATAFDYFDQLTVKAPDFAEGWNKRATVNYFIGALDASLADIAETLKREPHHFGALSGRGLVHMQAGELEAAIDAFEDAQK